MKDIIFLEAKIGMAHTLEATDMMSPNLIAFQQGVT